MREYNKWFGYIGRILLCAGIGGILTYCIIEWSKTKLPLIAETIEEWIVNGQPEALIVDAVVKFVLLASVMLVLIIILKFINYLKFHMLVLLVLFMLDIVGIIVAVVRGEIIPLFGFVIWVTISYCSWLVPVNKKNIMKFNLRQISYGYNEKYPDAKLRLLYALLKKYKLTLVENEIPFSKKIYLVRKSDLWWLLMEDCVGRKDKLQAAMFTCGSLDHIYNWICDKDDRNSLVYKQE